MEDHSKHELQSRYKNFIDDVDGKSVKEIELAEDKFCGKLWSKVYRYESLKNLGWLDSMTLG